MTIASRRQLLTGAAATVFGLSMAGTSTFAQQPAAAAAVERSPGQLNEEQLGQMIAALGVKPEKQQQRYDFAFRAKMGESEWELSMSAVLSQDEKTIWVMAWLDELPKSANEVPRNALLRLLAENDKIGNGKFFAYIPNNRRFVLQKIVPNENMTSAKFKVVLQDLGTTVVDTHGVWAVANWSESTNAAPAANTAANPGAQQPTRSAENTSRIETPIRR
jgi:hypothetical protein